MNKKRLLSAILAAAMIVAAASTSISASAAAVEEETSGATGTIKFDPGDWNSKKIYFYIWDDQTGECASKNGWTADNMWGSKKIAGKKLDDGTFESYEFEMPEDHDLFVIFYDPDKGAQTLDCYINADAFGDTAKRTGEILENPVDSEKSAFPVKFEKSGLTTKLHITSSGKIQGEIITPNMTPAKEVANFIVNNYGAVDKVTSEPVVTLDGIKAALTAFKVTPDQVWAEAQQMEQIKQLDPATVAQIQAVVASLAQPEPDPDPQPDPDPKPTGATKIGQTVDGVIIGDVDGDENITASDALMTLRASVDLAELNDTQAKAADIDEDNVVDSYDALMIIRNSVGLDK